MTILLEIKEFIISFYKKFEKIIIPLGKFLLTLIVLLKLNNFLGYYELFNRISVNIIIAAISIFVPSSWFILILMLIVTGQVFFASWEASIILLIIMIIGYLLFVKIFPKTAYLVYLVPLLFSIKLGYVIPIFAGLLLGPTTILSICLGVLVYRFSAYLPGLIEMHSLEIYDLPDTIMSMYKYIINSIANDQTTILYIIVFIFVILITYVVSKLEIDYIWYIAILTGAATNILGFIIGSLILKTDISIIGVIVGSILAIIICSIAQFMRFSLDYNRKEKVQFEDDDYYYYVKAIPKIKIARAEKEIKKIK